MIICINCNKEIKEKMDSLLNCSQYVDYSELISVAIDNLWVLNNEIGDKGTLVISDYISSPLIPPVSPPIQKVKPVSTGKPSSSSPNQNKVSSASIANVTHIPVRIPDLFLSDGLEKLSIVTVDVPQTESTEEKFSLDRWLFGQYNKLLPVKANCRALIRLAAGSTKGVPLEKTGALIAEAAMQLGDYLVNHDNQNQIARDDAFGTAFPRSGPDSEKSRSRYANQFVGSVNRMNVLSGLLWDYRLIALTSENNTLLLPTKQAVDLARLMNPILDSGQIEPLQKFSLEETGFFLNHIRSFVPVEAFAFRTLIQNIGNGADTPEKLDQALHFLVPADPSHSFSSSFLTSQRSGALSRMVDLNLITRERKGVRVSYIVTELGQTFIE